MLQERFYTFVSAVEDCSILTFRKWLEKEDWHSNIAFLQTQEPQCEQELIGEDLVDSASEVGGLSAASGASLFLIRLRFVEVESDQYHSQSRMLYVK